MVFSGRGRRDQGQNHHDLAEMVNKVVWDFTSGSEDC